MARQGVAPTCVAVLLVVAGCGPDRPDAIEAKALAEHVVTYKATVDGGDNALLEGTVQVVDGCFIVTQEGLQSAYLPLFPDDEVRWVDGRLEYNGEAYSDGDTIALPGGLSGRPDEAVVPESCAATGLTPWTVATQ
jgi:hypothetical protein